MDKGFVEVWLGGSLVGRIALTPDGLCAFEYDSKFLERGFSISPYVLPLEKSATRLTGISACLTTRFPTAGEVCCSTDS